MKKRLVCVLFVCIYLINGCSSSGQMKKTSYSISAEDVYNITAKRDILCLMMAYPEYIVGVERNVEGIIYLVMKSGKRIVYDDRKKKTADEKLNNGDLQDMMEQVYPIGQSTKIMERDFDPGRIRVSALLKEVYGEGKKKVESNLVNVNIGGKKYYFNRSNKAAESLQKTMESLKPIYSYKSDIQKSLFPISGTFNYRTIAGTKRLSAHSYGIAIDLARDKRDYWMWASRAEGEKRLASYPYDIVKVFEDNNYIWGGKWSHFDILHFEYRPELIIKSKYFTLAPLDGETWYQGVPYNHETESKYIQLIDRLL